MQILPNDLDTIKDSLVNNIDDCSLNLMNKRILKYLKNAKR